MTEIRLPIAVVLGSILHGHTVPQQVIVNMPGVQVSADDYLKPSAENLFRQLEANLMRQSRGDFSRGKALHQMIPLHAVLLVPHPLDAAHILESSFHCAAER